ncbi:MAG: hypothetical protein WHX53_01230 [Anaerolineae bacterium]
MTVDPFVEIAGRQRAAPRASLVEPTPPDLPLFGYVRRNQFVVV